MAFNKSGKWWRVTQALEDPRTYPMSVAVENKMDAEDLMNLFRTFYEDNEFNMQEGILAGWFGLPYRLEIVDEGRTDYADLKGMFARGLSIPRTAYCIVAHPVRETHSATGCSLRLWGG
jgi:hypothetical protein